MKIKVDFSLTVYNINIEQNKTHSDHMEVLIMDERFNGSNNDNFMDSMTGRDDTQYTAMPTDDREIFSQSDIGNDHIMPSENSPVEDNVHSKETTGSDSAYSFDINNSVSRYNPYSYSDSPRAKPSHTEYNSLSQQQQPAVAPAVITPKKKKNRRPLFAVLAICASLIISGGSFYAGVRYVDDHSTAAVTATTASDSKSSTPVIGNTTTVSVSSDSEEVTSTITDVVDNAMPSMVAINTIVEQTMDDYGYFNYFFGGGYGGQTYESSASGSGIIIGQNEDELLIVTNYHVIEDAKEIAIEFIDGQSYSAEVKGTASENDLAVVSVKLSDISADTLEQIKVATLGDSTTLKLGEPAIAIGNSLGYGQSVTVGYISATERTIQISDKTMTLIQTDAAINPGNSGGALLNIKGEVIGINSAKLSDTSVEGTGYAIPISDAAPIINDLMSSTYVSDEEKPYLGIYGSSVPETYQTRFNWPAGAYVSRVLSNSPAELAGIQSGDIITAIDDSEITGMEDLEKILADHKVGDKISITVARTDSKGNVKTGTLTATLIAKSESDDMTVG